ncbi:iron-containing redox enzyme family protein [Ornithinimicrobium cryptoxanthini]|uniref:Iron-containing redox enzyme family protein n=1 Tax=Ornithinimicrobium cryptoxanthini TaxID=2934161 RepID=A0ABY4YGU5_9MICO|nr:iron-containing redox enzyme family protein [Ornithinimicrobium cryptoxanthini]USQ75991.1 iron-containing redox enzyme family protein [Ornithinimicrobium cryptoxanthini]
MHDVATLAPMLPSPRGPLSERVVADLRTDPSRLAQRPTGLDAADDTDAALALWMLHELSYRGFDDVSPDAEWEPAVLTVRRELQRDLEGRLRDRWPGHETRGGDLADELMRFIEADDGPSVASYVHTRATREQVLELVRWRSIYHLRESDPSTWTLPRLTVGPKAALAELQYDEYGAGRPDRLHSHLFAEGMRALGLSTHYGAYVDECPLEVLEMNNVMSLFGLHGRLRGASMGHLAAFEVTSSVPSGHLARGLQRLGMPELVDYYTEHVVADSVHDQIAVRLICAALATDEPEQAQDIFFGAFTCLDQEARFARAILDRWAVAA